MTPDTTAAKIDYITRHPETVKTAFVQRFADAGYNVTVQYMPFRKKFAVYCDDEYALFTVEEVATADMGALVTRAIDGWRLPFA